MIYPPDILIIKRICPSAGYKKWDAGKEYGKCDGIKKLPAKYMLAMVFYCDRDLIPAQDHFS
ncbi:hypothetical protein HMPREF0880_01258 [Yokenella regensburgei ATCC 43003]|jgi:hypothetical protein|nr:hypothetical protein HMPREF0880_01258 [Yokenella regensburgei ATCC 43003]